MNQKTSEQIKLDIFSALDKRPDFPVEEINKKIALVSTPRCGSKMFCDILKNTKKVGFPGEWISMKHINAYCKYFGIPGTNLGDYINFMLRKTTSSNGVFAINFHVYQYTRLLKQKFNVFDLNFDYSYYLYRKDKIEQAHSFAKAAITDKWVSVMKAKNDTPDEIGRSRIFHALKTISDWEEYYSKHLKQNINREFFYEDYKSLSTTKVFTDILSDLEITGVEIPIVTFLKKQSDDKDQKEIAAIKEYLLPL